MPVATKSAAHITVSDSSAALEGPFAGNRSVIRHVTLYTDARSGARLPMTIGANPVLRVSRFDMTLIDFAVAPGSSCRPFSQTPLARREEA